MMTTPVKISMEPVHLTDDEFYQICQNNRELKLERTPKGELVIMSPVGGDGGNQESELNADLVVWNRQNQLGFTFSSSTLFKLPNGGERSPDVAWIQRERWLALTPEQRRKFPPIAPDFVIELRSPSDSLAELRSKMLEYLNSGVRLGWLINPQDQQIEIYRERQSVEIINLPNQLSGEDVLPGFTLNLPRF